MASTNPSSIGRRVGREVAIPALALLTLCFAADAHARTLDASAASAKIELGGDAAEGDASKPKGTKKSGKKSKGKSTKKTDDTGASGDGGAAGADAGGKDAKDAKKPGPASSVPEPPPALEVQLPVKVKGKGKPPSDAKGRLTGRLEAAVAGAKVEGGPYRIRMSMSVAKKKNYTLTLTVVDAADKQVAEVSEPCKGCSVGEAGDKVAALVGQAVVAIEEAAKAPGTVTVTTTPPGALVSVDGTQRGPAPQDVELSPGEHTVVVSKDGFLEQRQTVTVEPRSEQKLDLSLEMKAAPSSDPKPDKGDKGDEGGRDDKGKKTDDVPKGPKAGKPWTIAGGVVLGLGLASVATGVALILVDEEPIPSECKGDQVDFRGICRVRYNTLGSGIIAATVGALGIGGGIALMIKGRQVTVKARGSKTSASVGVQIRF